MQADIKEANQRVDLFSEHLIQGFFLQYDEDIADRDCGSNNDFLIMVNSIRVVFSEQKSLLERIESARVMTRKGKQAIQNQEDLFKE